MYSIFVQDQREVMFMKGAVEHVLNQCSTYLMTGNHVGLHSLPLAQNQINKVLDQAKFMGSTGLRGKKPSMKTSAQNRDK